MTHLLDEQYLTWLYSQVGSVKLRARSRTYWSLLRHLYTKEFVWFVPNDDNRVEDGRDLRHEFVTDLAIDDPDTEWMRLGCSMLEMMIGLSRRLFFEAEGEPRWWFWHLVSNIGLEPQNDSSYSFEVVDEAVEMVIWRTYNRNGKGGLFPLENDTKDQRRVELWYQLNSYLLEHD